MALPRLADEINRLFDELVHSQWSRRIGPARQVSPPSASYWEVEIPAPGVKLDDLSLALEGQHLTVIIRRRASRQESRAGAEVTTRAEEYFRQTFTLPADADVNAIEARFEAGVLRIRVGLRSGAAR